MHLRPKWKFEVSRLSTSLSSVYHLLLDLLAWILRILLSNCEKWWEKKKKKDFIQNGNQSAFVSSRLILNSFMGLWSGSPTCELAWEEGVLAYSPTWPDKNISSLGCLRRFSEAISNLKACKSPHASEKRDNDHKRLTRWTVRIWEGRCSRPLSSDKSLVTPK